MKKIFFVLLSFSKYFSKYFPPTAFRLGVPISLHGLFLIRWAILAECTEVVWITSVAHRHYTFLLELSFTATAMSTEVVWKVQKIQNSKFETQNSNFKFSKFKVRIFKIQNWKLKIQNPEFKIKNPKSFVRLLGCTAEIMFYNFLGFWNWGSKNQEGKR